MKIKYLLSVVVGSLLMANIVIGQTTTLKTPVTNGIGWTDAKHDSVLIAGGTGNIGNFETVINGDTLPNSNVGTRANINTVYILQAGTVYLQTAALNIVDTLGTVTIIGLPTGGSNQRPVLLKYETAGTPIQQDLISASLTIKNIQYESEDLSNAYCPEEGEWYLTGKNVHLEVDNSLFEFDAVSIFDMQSCPIGAEVRFVGNYFRDQWSNTQWWWGRPFYGKVQVDTFIFANNTVSWGGLTCLGQKSLTQWAFIDHNTLINNIKYPFLNDFYLTCYVTNNVFVNCLLAGDDSINVIWKGGQDPDGIRCGIVGVDTINEQMTRSAIQKKYLNTDSSINTNLVGLANIVFYAAGNYCVGDTLSELIKYYHGTPFDGNGNHALDSAASYLEWNVKVAGPYGVMNSPETFINSRGYALAKDYKHIVVAPTIHPNHEYDMTVAALGMPTASMDTMQANYWIQWNRNAYGVPGVAAPTGPQRFAFGDFDPTTIPGPGQKEVSYTSAKGGITAFTDLKENFKVTKITSDIDGLPIGSLIWGNGTYNLSSSLATVKAAYSLQEGVNDATGASAVTLTVGPNPVKNVTTISFDLPSQTKAVLTVTDLSGKVVATLVDASLEGAQSVTFDASGLANGLYILQLKTNETVVTGKLIKQ